MCLIAFALNENRDYPFILIANRDEFYDRRTEPIHFWPDHPKVLAGKDLKAGGSWMGITKDGRFCAVTNYRDIKHSDPNAQSRGELVTNFLTSNLPSQKYLQELQNTTVKYNGYNLLTWQNKNMHHYSNYQGTINELSNGIHALSNALLDTPWYKVKKIKEVFIKVINNDLNEQLFFEILADTSTADDNDLPQTGLPYELEKAVSAMCIRTEKYGTVSSSVVTINTKGQVSFVEKTYAVGGRKEGIKRFNFQLS